MVIPRGKLAVIPEDIRSVILPRKYIYIHKSSSGFEKEFSRKEKDHHRHVFADVATVFESKSTLSIKLRVGMLYKVSFPVLAGTSGLLCISSKGTWARECSLLATLTKMLVFYWHRR